MIRLGLSVYPEQESLEQIETYLEKGKQAGFDKVFTSLFSVEGTREEVIAYFRAFSEIAHRLGYEVDGDCNAAFFDRMGASADDLSVFREMGIDILRMDTPFRDERDATLINNQEGLKIEFNTSMIDVVEQAEKNGADLSRITTCHNFYPQRYTCPAFDAIQKMNACWNQKGIEVDMFMSSQVPGTHGPWPVSDGLPTLEEDRDIPIDSQLKHMLAMKTVDVALIGNAFASDEEFEAIRRTMDSAGACRGVQDLLQGDLAEIRAYLPEGELVRIPFRLHLNPKTTDAEKAFVFDFPLHCDLGDCLNYMLRSRWTRFAARSTPVPVRPCSKDVFEKGDVLIVNDACRHYAGEVQIVLKEMKNDGQRNWIGTIDKAELRILDLLGGGDVFTFVED